MRPEGREDSLHALKGVLHAHQHVDNLLASLAGVAWPGSVVLAICIADLTELPITCVHRGNAGNANPSSICSGMKSDDIDTVVRLVLSNMLPAGSLGSTSTEAAAPVCVALVGPSRHRGLFTTTWLVSDCVRRRLPASVELAQAMRLVYGHCE